MGCIELMEFLGMSGTLFYRLRRAKVIEAPKGGDMRKHYTDEQVVAIQSKVELWRQAKRAKMEINRINKRKSVKVKVKKEQV